MENLSMMAQIAVALSVAFVWTFRYHNVITEFKTFGLSDLLVTGIWFPAVLLPAALLMGFFMVSAQGFHFKIKNTFIKHLPSLILLVLCGFIAFEAMN
jgi:hypothetical protein